MKIDRNSFFAAYREAFSPLNQKQVDGLEFLLGAIEKDTWTVEQAAYVLATIQHETAGTFRPIKEYRSKEGTHARVNQDRYWLTGYYGRGYIQLTWKKNYEKFGIADTPDEALEPETAYRIASEGMRDGLFTGHKLSEFIGDYGKIDFVNARKVINGLDRAKDIADNAEKFLHILQTPVEEKPPAVIPEVPKPADTSTVVVHREEVSKKSLFSTIGTAIVGVLSSIGVTIEALKQGVTHLNPTVVAYLALTVALVIVGLYFYDRSKARAAARQSQLIQAAASPTENTVRLE